MPNPADQRPLLAPGLSGAEFLRWYWLKDELADFARRLGIRSTGGKDLLAQRIAARLDGREHAEPPAARRSGMAQLAGQLSPSVLVPAGQRCSQVLRAWFTEQVGPSFHFDAELRAFFANTDGTQTLADALAHWRRTRDGGQKLIDGQFEYNRFTRGWHEEHPAGTKTELLAAWREYRSQPIDVRGRA